MEDLKPQQCQAVVTKKQAAIVRNGILIAPAKLIKTRCTQYARDHDFCTIHARMQREGKQVDHTEG